MSVKAIVGGAAIVAAVGVGAVILAPGLIRAARPSLLKALTQGMALARVGRAQIESAWEDFEDFVAEATAAAHAQGGEQAAQAASNVTWVDKSAATAQTTPTAGSANNGG
jgi:hypothetical protein